MLRVHQDENFEEWRIHLLPTCTDIHKYSEPSVLGQVFTPESASSELRVTFVLPFDPSQKSELSQGCVKYWWQKWKMFWVFSTKTPTHKHWSLMWKPGAHYFTLRHFRMIFVLLGKAQIAKCCIMFFPLHRMPSYFFFCIYPAGTKCSAR